MLAVSADVLCAAIATATPHDSLNLDCTVLGLDRAKGTKLWAYDTKMSELAAFSTGSMAGNVMFVGETNENGTASTPTGGVVALDLRDGTRKWTYTLSDMIEGTPVVAHV